MRAAASSVISNPRVTLPCVTRNWSVWVSSWTRRYLLKVLKEFFLPIIPGFKPRQLMRIINKTKNTVIAPKAQLADTAFSRLKGLLGRDGLCPGEALIITQCRSIHMFFMRFAIDVVFVDKKNRVVGTVKRIKPFLMSPYFWRATAAI